MARTRSMKMGSKRSMPKPQRIEKTPAKILKKTPRLSKMMPSRPGIRSGVVYSNPNPGPDPGGPPPRDM